jgi:hypothetical protein
MVPFIPAESLPCYLLFVVSCYQLVRMYPLTSKDAHCLLYKFIHSIFLFLYIEGETWAMMADQSTTKQLYCSESL